MYLFKTSGQTFDSVIHFQKHALPKRPREWAVGEILLVSKNKSDCARGEKQIGYTMRLSAIRESTNEEIERYWPGNPDRWKYIVDCTGTEPVPIPFNLKDVLGDSAQKYDAVFNFKKISPEDETIILPTLALPALNSTDELPQTQVYVEGAVRSIVVNAYERNLEARAACLAHYGVSCQTCGFNFENSYGPLGAGFIHVHHIISLADIGERYVVNPITDLIPVCANCHSMIHRRRPALSVSELSSLLNQRRAG